MEKTPSFVPTHYSEIAEASGTHHRTVGVAMRRNPTPLIIPCHRVVSKTGLGGYSPDISIKKDLLNLEKKVLRKKSRSANAASDEDPDKNRTED